MSASVCSQSLPLAAPKFDAAFIERRMSQHRAWQEQKIAEGAAEIVSEVVSALDHVMKVRAQNQKRLAR